MSSNSCNSVSRDLAAGKLLTEISDATNKILFSITVVGKTRRSEEK